MSLQSLRFRHDERLTLAAENAPAMRKGEKGHAVRLVQQALIDLGYAMPISTATYGSPDGDFGAETKSKVWQFQHDNHLGKDGVVGRQTMGRLDELLKGKAFTTLPDIPGPGGAKNIGMDAELVIREVLASSILNSVNFTLEYSQKQRQPDFDDKRPNPVVKVHRATFRGSNYLRVAEAVADGSIVIQTGASSHTAAQYIPNNRVPGFPENTILIGRELRVERPNDRSVIVHEGAHAVCDIQRINVVNALFSEMIAYFAEAYYRQLTGLGPKGGLLGDAAVVYRSADAAVKFMRKGQDGPEHLLDQVWFALDATHPGFINQQVVYDGI